MNITQIFLIANIICAIGTLLQVKDVIKNRTILKGYSFLGSLLTFLAVAFFQFGFYLTHQYLSVSLGFITVVYWLLVTIYTGIPRIKKLYYYIKWFWTGICPDEILDEAYK